MGVNEPSGAARGVRPPATTASAAAETRRRLEAMERGARHLEVPVATGIAVLGLVVGAGGLTRRGLLAVGAWLVALAALILWARALRNRTERGIGPRGPAPRLTALDGDPATAVTAHPTRVIGTVGMWLLLATPLVGSGAALLSGGEPVAGGVLVGAGALWLAPVALVAAGRISPGGVWLTPSAVVIRDHGLESRIPWSALAAVADGAGTDAANGTVVLRAHGATGTIHRGRSRPWPVSARTAGPRIAVVDARWLALDAPALATVLRHYQRSGTTGELGSPASLRTIGTLTGSHS